MKKTVLLLIFVLSVLGMISCIPAYNSAKEIDKGEGYKIFEIGDFKELIASDVDVYIKIGEPTEKLRLEADSDIIDAIEIANKRGTLSINDKDDKSGKNGIDKAKIHITAGAAQIKTIMASAGAEVILQQEIPAETFATDATIRVSPEAFR